MRLNQSDFAELVEAIEIGMDQEPTPICAADFCEILVEQGDSVNVGDVYRALESLYKDGKIDRDVMFDTRRQCTVNHYFGHEWDGFTRFDWTPIPDAPR